MAEKIAEWIGCVIVAVVATLIFGATQHAAQWIAHAPDPEAALKGATTAFDAMLNGLLR